MLTELQRAFVFAMVLLGLATPALAGEVEREAQEIDRIVQKDPRKAAAAAQNLLQEALAKHDKRLQLRALRILANAHTQLGNMFVLGEDIAKGEQLAKELNHHQARVEFIIARGNDAELERKYAKADRSFSDGIAFAQQHQLKLGLANCYGAMAMAGIDRGIKANVVVYATKAYEQYENHGDLRGMAQMLTTMGLASGDVHRNLGYLERAIDMSDTAANRWDATLMKYYLGEANFRAGNYMKAGFALKAAFDGATELGVPVYGAYANYYLGRLALAERRFSEAVEFWDRALPVFSQTNDLPALFETQRFRADALSALERKTDSALALQAARSAAQAVSSLEARGKAVPRASRLQGPFVDYLGAFQELSGKTDQVSPGRSGSSVTASMAQARFDAKLRETENALLREQKRAAELERITLVLALMGSVVILGLGILVLIRQIRQKSRFADLAMRDELTGLRNRRSILEFARVQFSTRTTLGTRLFIAILDLDHFKSVNDEFGHDVGDAVLIAFAATCQRHLRSNHVFGRFGGEEFLLVMPDTREDQVFEIFERLSEVVGELTVAGLTADRRLSFSMGAADVRAPASSVEDLIKNADIALYRAKEKGRDRCEIHDGELQAAYDVNVLRSRRCVASTTGSKPGERVQLLNLRDPSRVSGVASQ